MDSYTILVLAFVHLLITALCSAFILSDTCLSNTRCDLVCSSGYAKDKNGCFMCKCASAQGASDLHSYHPQNAYSNPCQPHVQFCPLICTNGFLTGSGGCQFCICNNDTKSGTTPDLPQSTTALPLLKVQMSNPCIPGQTTCDRYCKDGYLLGPGNCQYCLCKIPGLVYTTAAPTTVPLTTTRLPLYLRNPCQAGHHICDADCQYGYILGPDNCEYCMCAAQTTQITVPSGKPGGNDGTVSRAPTTTLPSGHMSNECVIANTICQVKCKHGFMADTVDCKTCVCKDEIYKSVGVEKPDEPDIKLMNPCVQGLDVCNIFCFHGYLRGPRDCQYCACRM